MTAAMIAQLLVMFGPSAITLIQQLVSNWSREMSPEEVRSILALASKTYEQYIEEAKKKVLPIV